IEADGSEKIRQAAASLPPRKKWKIAVVNYVESIPCEETMEGLHAAAKRSKLVEGLDYEMTVRSAQGDMAALSGIFDAVLTDGADIVVPLSTPALQVAIQKIRDRPVLFSVVANPVAAGAGTSYTEHLPNVTGVSVLAPIEEALDTIERHFPRYRRIGTLFCPAEANSVDLRDSMEASCRRRGITLECVAVNSPGELPDATLALVSRPIDAIVQVSDNLSNAGFSAITRAARQAKMPLLSLNSTTVELGAAISFGRDYRNTGEVTMELIERVIGGEDPGKIPFILPPKLYFSASLPNARELGMSLPQGLLDEVGIVIQ
ncbi:MAG: ABC transporter substrate-binding protein, partial [Verrucomicrobiales bacterium]